jgi:hypothetical protein
MSRTYRGGKPLKKERASEPKRKIQYKDKKDKRSKDSIALTDRAIVRFIERVLKIDVDFVLNAVVSEKLAAMAKIHGDGIYPGEYGEERFRAVIKQGKVVTIKKKD